jgi:hypothetical protein
MSPPVYSRFGANCVLHELQSRANFANHHGHLAKIFKWRSAGHASARSIKSDSPFEIPIGATRLFLASRPSTRSLAIEAGVP